ncbi:glutaminase [Ophiostoma piceae UAMH 11346]|uniref:Glutaminase n=1 Tax=Ophiostoma piceae (strain UAMH 11346) TaxID=1262450 RepID=S3D468_OPHP1|nr:glutaminase [Ophiostoma piceae UAMH 11346]
MAVKSLFLSLLSVLAVVTPLTSASTFTPLRPPAIPLAVRSPYLSTWLNGDSGGILPGSWPRFWADQIVGWQGLIRVDNVAYNWMGDYNGPAHVTQTSFEYTSTQSIFTFDVAGKVTLTATFLSPVHPNDLLLQSLQMSYLQLSVKSADGSAHDVQVYSDVSGEWASPDHSQALNWGNGINNGCAYHRFALANQVELREDADMAKWGMWLFGTDYRTGRFVDNGTLDNSESTTFRAISDSWPVFALAVDLGSVSTGAQEVLYSIGVVQEKVITFQGDSDGLEELAGLWTTHYSIPEDSFAAFHNNWDQELHDAQTLDAKVHNDAFEAGGQDYASLTTLAVRQAFGGLQVAHGTRQDYIFLKEISSDGDIQTVDVIFPAHPIFLYFNPELLKLILDPLFENQESGHYPNPWSIHDLGFFPNADGFPEGNDEAMPVEECGNMIIMTLAYALRSGNTQYLEQHWPLLDQWAQFLVNDSLIPDSQLSTDDFAGRLANQTNLALKGIIGVRAMADVAKYSGTANADVASNTYLQTAQDYISKWQGYGINTASTPPHTTLAYNDNDSHGLLYNIYADRLLGLGLVPDSVYEMQSAFYETIMEDFGIPLDTRHDWTKSDWEIFAAAVASDSVKAEIIERVVKMVEATTSGRPLTDLYDAATGNFPVDGNHFMNRPVVGGFFALLALPK